MLHRCSSMSCEPAARTEANMKKVSFDGDAMWILELPLEEEEEEVTWECWISLDLIANAHATGRELFSSSQFWPLHRRSLEYPLMLCGEQVQAAVQSGNTCRCRCCCCGVGEVRVANSSTWSRSILLPLLKGPQPMLSSRRGASKPVLLSFIENSPHWEWKSVMRSVGRAFLWYWC